MSLFLCAYEIDEQIANLSGDKLSAYVVLDKPAIPGSVQIIVDGETTALESVETGQLFNYHGPYQKASSNKTNPLERNDVNHKTREVVMTFLKPVKEVRVQYFYMPEEDEN